MNGSPIRSVATKSTKNSKLTIKDLYQALDWSRADGALADFMRDQSVSAEISAGNGQNEDFSYRFRLNLLNEALYGLGEPQQTAKRLLHMAGIWPQVVEFMGRQGLLIPSVTKYRKKKA